MQCRRGAVRRTAAPPRSAQRRNRIAAVAVWAAWPATVTVTRTVATTRRLRRRARELEPALAAAQDALALCAAQGDRHREAALHNNIADLLHDGGRSEEAMAHLKQAVALFAEIGEPDVPQPEVWKLVEW